jgi:hypothetical protein
LALCSQSNGRLSCGFWYHWKKIDEIGEMYIQIENSFEYGIKLVIKIAEWEQSTQTLYRILNEIKPIAERHGLMIKKPDRYRAGYTSTQLFRMLFK